MRSENKSLATMVMTALITAIVLLSTLIFKIPIGVGYIHLGDAIVFLGVIILPRKHACFAGAIGAGLADIVGGFAAWAPWTFAIKLIVVLILGFFLDRVKADDRRLARVPLKEGLGYFLATIVGTSGYYLAEGIMYGNWIAPIAGIPFNLLQMIVGAVIAVFISNGVAHSSLGASTHYKR